MLADLPPEERARFWRESTTDKIATLKWDWNFWGRPEQQEPDGDWSTWLILAGRGFGKTRTGSEWVRKIMCGPTPLAAGRVQRLALVAETAADARDVMTEGPAGILAVHPPGHRPKYSPSIRRLTWPNGSQATLYSAEDPEQLRGPEHEAAWSDETAKWRYAQETWDMLQFGLRGGNDPRQLVTTTPKPTPLIRELVKDPTTFLTRGSTYDNASNLAARFLQRMRDRYEGTRLGRQELAAEILDDVPGALWTRAMFDVRSEQAPRGAGMRRGESFPAMRKLVIGVDPSGSDGSDEDNGDDIGIIVAGKGFDGLLYVLDDCTCQLGPAGWGRRVAQQHSKWEADYVVAERNFGGAMVEYVIRTADRKVHTVMVSASRGKAIRAEPIAALYEQGKVRHAGTFAQLEDECINMTPQGFNGNRSPNRLDAMVWALSALEFGHEVPQAITGTYARGR
jgi:phage terminase large subunit-like protein